MKQILIVLVVLGCQAQAPPGLGNPTYSVKPQMNVRAINPRYENGRAVVFDGDRRSRLLLYGTTGQLERENEVSWPSAVRVTATGVSVSREGVVAVGGGATKASDVVSFFVLVFDKAGPPVRVIETTPFLARQVALSPDGNVWVMGADREAEKGSRDFGVFRKYTLDGKLLGQFVPRSSFPRWPDPSMGIGGSSGMTMLWATHRGIGAYVSGSREWIELDNVGEVVGRWKPRPPSGHADIDMGGIAFTESGAVYVYPRYGYDLVLCRLDKAENAWAPIAGTERKFGTSPFPALLLGADGNQLVFRWSSGEWFWFNEPR